MLPEPATAVPETPAKSPASGREAQGGAGALDLHGGIDDPSPEKALQGCPRWAAGVYLRSSVGELVRGRCRATNLCAYCQRLYVVETVEMLTLDAMEHAPTLWLVLTAREHLTRAGCSRHLSQLRTAARRRWPEIQWFVQVEFQRRGALHVNLLIKGVPVEDRQALHDLLVDRWCARVDALPVGQWSGAIADGVGVVRYISKMLAHGLKAEQAPPIGWRGHRTSQTRGYLVRPASVMRREARESLSRGRELWKAEQAGLSGDEAYMVAERALLARQVLSWVFVVTQDQGRSRAPAAVPPAPLRAPPPLTEREAFRELRFWRKHLAAAP
jgi:hypothetical protein